MNLPESPGRRRIVVVLSPADFEHLDDRRPAGYDRQDVQFISSQTDGSKNELVLKLSAQHDLVPGLTLVMNPFDTNSYIDAEAASQELVVRKAHIVARLAQLLGARSIEIVAATDLVSGKTVDVKSQVSAGPGGGEVSVEARNLVKHAQSAALSDQFPGSDPDVGTARSLLVAAGLDDDMVLTGLVEARSHEKNRLAKRQLTVNMTRESERTIAAALTLRYGIGKAAVKGNAKATSKSDERTSISFTYQIDF